MLGESSRMTGHSVGTKSGSQTRQASNLESVMSLLPVHRKMS